MREKILSVIEKNSRIDIEELAILLGEDETAIANEIADMEKEGVICGYHTLINWDKTNNEKVNAVYLMSGSFDFTVFIEGRTMRDVAQFVSDKLAPMDSVLSTATHFVLKKYKDHGTILSAKKKDERQLITP